MTLVLALQVPEWLLDYWHPSEKAMYPDYFSKREQWKQLRMKSWNNEVGFFFQSVFFCFYKTKIVNICMMIWHFKMYVSHTEMQNAQNTQDMLVSRKNLFNEV